MATKWGIVSVGKISHDFVSCLRSLPKEEHQVVAVAARSLARAKDFATLHNVKKAYGSYDELANDKDIEIVYIGALNPQHFELGVKMLQARKHVLLEKPMGMNSKQVKELTALAREKKLFLMEGVWSRFFPVYHQLRNEIDKKTIGEIVHVHATQGFTGKDVGRVQDKSLGGGAILDIGVYTVNAATFIFGGKPIKISAVGVLNEHGVDQRVAASMLYKNGGMANIALSTTAELPNELVVCGTKGVIKIPQPYWCPTEIQTPSNTLQFPLPDTVLPCNFTNSSGLRYEAMAVRDCLNQGLTECPEMTLDDSEMVAEIMDELRHQVGVNYPEDD